MAFQLLVGDCPFPAATLSELHEAHGRPICYDSGPWLSVSAQARSLVSQLLQREDALRPTCEQALGLVQGVEGSGWLPHCEQEPAASSPLSLPSKAFCNSQSVDKSNLMRGAQEAPMRPPKVKILYLVRHGEAIHNIKEQQAQQKAAADCTAVGLLPASKEFKARVELARQQVLEDESLHDPPLSPAGKTQALHALSELNMLLARGLPRPGRIFVSPLERTLQTAAIVFPGHPGIHVREELRERRTGLPCDERHQAEDVAMRSTFCFMSFDQLRSHDRNALFARQSSAKEARYARQSSAPVQERQSSAPVQESSLGPLVPNLTSNRQDSPSSLSAELPEDKAELRGRTAQIAELLRDVPEDALAVVTHKGFLRELEHGPFGRPDATEFGNCEVRVYDVTLPAEGGMLA
ncbi:unnamed protein product, partial [Polarella glacialis]